MDRKPSRAESEYVILLIDVAEERHSIERELVDIVKVCGAPLPWAMMVLDSVDRYARSVVAAHEAGRTLGVAGSAEGGQR